MNQLGLRKEKPQDMEAIFGGGMEEEDEEQ
jgi:hypothetical protein